MAAEEDGGVMLPFSVASVVEDVLQQHGNTLGDLDFESRKAQEAASRRYEAAMWLRKMVGVVAAKYLPAELSEEEFRLGLRSGIILCNVLNKIQPASVPKVVETSPCDAALNADGAALSAFQYFENARNFLLAVEKLGIPNFEASDLQQGGKTIRIVNTVLGLKSFWEWKQAGGSGVWKFGANVKPNTIMTSKSIVRNNSGPFTNSLSRTTSMNGKSRTVQSHDIDSNKMSNSGSLSKLVHAVLLDKKPEEVPMLVESVLSKLVEEFEHRMSNQREQVTTPTRPNGNKAVLKSAYVEKKVSQNEEKSMKVIKKEDHRGAIAGEELKAKRLKQQVMFDQHQKQIQELKHTISTTKAGMQFMQMKYHEEFSNLGVHVHGLARAASGYHKILEENRKLYNQVQDLKGSIRVYCRVRPFSHGQSSYFSSMDRIEEGTITINTQSKSGKGQKSFNFNKVFGPSASQAEVFSDVQPLIRSVLDGYNVCIFAYGQTGSGKTYTMTGPKELTEKNLGVDYRALSDLFRLAEQRKDTFRYDIAVQMIEIYNEQVRDLLVTDGSNKRLEIHNSTQTGLNVPDANFVPVSSTSDVINLMNIGQRNRAVGATALNDRSSRSHSCLTAHVQGRDLTSGSIFRGCMNLVDLAGSERVDKSEATGDRLKEAQHINKSLSALGDVIASLAHKNPHVPYRNSKLTQLLQDSLGGQAKTLMFVHVSPETDSIGETISTLKFAERVATVELGAARVNKDCGDVKELKEQIVSLKAALARKDADMEHVQHSFSGSSERCRMKASEPSPFNFKQTHGDKFVEQNSYKQPMGNVGNLEVRANSASRQKKQSFDLDDILGNSPPWPPVKSPGHNYRDEDKYGEWVDKIIVNKVENPLGCWGPDNGQVYYQNFLPDSTRIYPDRSYNMFMRNNRFSISGSGDMDDLDAATSDSSEHDLLWQFNHAGITSGIQSKIKKPTSKSTRSSEIIRNLNPVLGCPSPSRKQIPVHRNSKLVSPSDGKQKTGNRK